VAAQLSGLGRADVRFAAGATESARLTFDPSELSGDPFTETLVDFSSTEDALDLAGQYKPGMNVSESGSQLTVTFNGSAYHFAQSGTAAAACSVTDDGNGGALIKPSAMAQAMAALPARRAPAEMAPGSAGASHSAVLAVISG
jgi:hypothetical protein